MFSAYSLWESILFSVDQIKFKISRSEEFHFGGSYAK